MINTTVHNKIFETLTLSEISITNKIWSKRRKVPAAIDDQEGPSNTLPIQQQNLVLTSLIKFVAVDGSMCQR